MPIKPSRNGVLTFHHNGIPMADWNCSFNLKNAGKRCGNTMVLKISKNVQINKICKQKQTFSSGYSGFLGSKCPMLPKEDR